MAKAIYVDEKTGIVILAAIAIVAWAVLLPESFDSVVSTSLAVIEGAIEGATESL